MDQIGTLELSYVQITDAHFMENRSACTLLVTVEEHLSCKNKIKNDFFNWAVYLNSCHYSYLSPVMRKPAFCICENKGADQLRGNREADRRLCFRYTDSAISLLPK